MATFEDVKNPIKLDAHKTRHQVGGADEIFIVLNEYTASLTLTPDHELVLMDATSSNITITLPTAAFHTNRIYTIKKIDSTEHTVTIDANSTETIDGETTVKLKLQYSYVTIVCDGDEWLIIGGMNVKLEDLFSDVKDLLTDSLDRQEKSLVIQAEALEHTKDASTTEPDREEVEEKLRDMLVEVVD